MRGPKSERERKGGREGELEIDWRREEDRYREIDRSA